MMVILNKITMFSFRNRLYHKNSNNENNNDLKTNMLGYYLAGLIEGDGSIIVPKTLRNQKGKLLYPRVKITFVDKDAPLAIKIKEVFGAGTLEYPINTKYVNLLFQDVDSLQKIAVHLNGKMRTPKIEALHRMIDWLNARSTSNLELNNQNIIKLGLDVSPLGNNPWLSGFIEADGNFYGLFSINSVGIADGLSHYMRISQKTTYSNNPAISKENCSNLHIMEKIREFLDVKVVSEIKRTKENFVELSYEVRTSKISSSGKLIDYLSKHPLFSSKHQDFLCWSEIHEIRLSKHHKTVEGTSRLIFLKNSMNTLRTQFNWDSLNRFYTI